MNLLNMNGFDVQKLIAPHPGGWPKEDLLCLESLVETTAEICCDLVSSTGKVEPEQVVDRIVQHFGLSSRKSNRCVPTKKTKLPTSTLSNSQMMG